MTESGTDLIEQVGKLKAQNEILRFMSGRMDVLKEQLEKDAKGFMYIQGAIDEIEYINLFIKDNM